MSLPTGAAGRAGGRATGDQTGRLYGASGSSLQIRTRLTEYARTRSAPGISRPAQPKPSRFGRGNKRLPRNPTSMTGTRRSQGDAEASDATPPSPPRTPDLTAKNPAARIPERPRRLERRTKSFSEPALGAAEPDPGSVKHGKTEGRLLGAHRTQSEHETERERPRSSHRSQQTQQASDQECGGEKVDPSRNHGNDRRDGRMQQKHHCRGHGCGGSRTGKELSREPQKKNRVEDVE